VVSESNHLASRSGTDVTHVGIYVGNGQMVDAPYTGAEVRVESFPTAVGASWGTVTYLGATSIDDLGHV
jgi:cell wall-associated NlpC family hydrolase